MFRRKEKDGTVRLDGAVPLSISAVISLIHPVNSIIMTQDNVNPGTRLTGTTWVAWGMGRMVLAIGTVEANTDTARGTIAAAAYAVAGSEVKGGEPDHLLADSEHVHQHLTPISFDGAVVYVVKTGVLSAQTSVITNNRAIPTIASTANAAARIDGTGSNINVGNVSHNNVPPYITCYMWKRTV